MAAYLSPIGNEQQSDASGNPLAGGFIFSYIAGTSTLAATYADASGLIPQANPIVLNASGLPASPIYINGGTSMKFIIQNSASVTQRTIDNIQGVNDPAFTGSTTEWINYSGAPTFVSSTSFSVTGDQTLTFQINRRVKTQNSGGTIYSTISNAVFGSGITTVTVVNDAGVLDSGLSNVQYALLAATNPSIPETSMGRSLRTAANASSAFATTRIDVASATTVNLTSLAPSTQHINITGTTTITGFTVASGVYYFVRFNAALTLTNGASLVTQTGANITTAAGDTCIIRATAANTVEVLCYRGVATEAQAGVVELASAAEALALTATDRAVSPARLKDAFSATGSAPMFACRAWVNFDGTGTVAIRASGNVSSITDNGVGDYTVNFTTSLPDANYAWAISCNGNSSGMQSGAQLSGTATAPTLISSSQMRFNTGSTSGGTNIDMSHVSAVFFR